jgi:hypothetical protein
MNKINDGNAVSMIKEFVNREDWSAFTRLNIIKAVIDTWVEDKNKDNSNDQA